MDSQSKASLRQIGIAEGEWNVFDLQQGSAKARDPSVPKPSRTPFNSFAAEARPKAKAAYLDAPQPDITKKVPLLHESTCTSLFLPSMLNHILGASTTKGLSQGAHILAPPGHLLHLPSIIKGWRPPWKHCLLLLCRLGSLNGASCWKTLYASAFLKYIPSICCLQASCE